MIKKDLNAAEKDYEKLLNDKFSDIEKKQLKRCKNNFIKAFLKSKNMNESPDRLFELSLLNFTSAKDCERKNEFEVAAECFGHAYGTLFKGLELIIHDNNNLSNEQLNEYFKKISEAVDRLDDKNRKIDHKILFNRVKKLTHKYDDKIDHNKLEFLKKVIKLFN